MEGNFHSRTKKDQIAVTMMSCLVNWPGFPVSYQTCFQLTALETRNVPRGQERKGNTCESTLEHCWSLSCDKLASQTEISSKKRTPLTSTRPKEKNMLTVLRQSDMLKKNLKWDFYFWKAAEATLIFLTTSFCSLQQHFPTSDDYFFFILQSCLHKVTQLCVYSAYYIQNE